MSAFAFQDVVPDAGQPQILVWMGMLAGISLVPFLLALITSFAKLVIVGGLLRQALGLQQVPPTTVLTGLAMIMTFHVMAPVVDRALTAATIEGRLDYEQLLPAATAAISGFLTLNTDPAERELLVELMARQGRSEPPAESLQQAIVRLLTEQAPAFLLTELAEAFLIGFILFVPFVVIDLVIANVLLAMGMSMLTPTTISVPVKLMVFVFADGWRLLFEQLLSGYRLPA
ncbi:MAG: EscR/YscR/HrcR family type III secretion system export apparatus protein [Planctomycetes bacterium]|nr:EscR/YscR/HrcR family type III secretion system export apparatus protein [Planctomycetota bacterium]